MQSNKKEFKMAKSASERQAQYRNTRSTSGDNGERRVNTFVTTSAFLALERLSNRYAVTKKEMLEKLLLSADENITKTLDIDSKEWKEYFVTQ
jgi:hypothetical protein